MEPPKPKAKPAKKEATKAEKKTKPVEKKAPKSEEIDDSTSKNTQALTATLNADDMPEESLAQAKAKAKQDEEG